MKKKLPNAQRKKSAADATEETNSDISDAEAALRKHRTPNVEHRTPN
jgi:hypothetical protein